MCDKIKGLGSSLSHFRVIINIDISYDIKHICAVSILNSSGSLSDLIHVSSEEGGTLPGK